MTLAVVIKFPWPEFYDSLPQRVRAVMDAFPRHRPSPAVLMAADSRWTWTSGTTDDGGVKLSRVDSHAVATYSGNTEAGERALARLSEDFRRAKANGRHDTVVPEKVLQSVWHDQRDRRGGLQVCLGGFFGVSLEPAVLRFDHDSEFRPQEIAGIEAIGTGAALFLNRFQEEVRRQMSEPLTERALAVGAEHWNTVIARLVAEISASQAETAVGGPILGAIVTPAGAEGRSLYRIDPRADKPEAERLSLTPDEVESFYNRQKTRVPAIKPPRYYGPRSAR